MKQFQKQVFDSVSFLVADPLKITLFSSFNVTSSHSSCSFFGSSKTKVSSHFMRLGLDSNDLFSRTCQTPVKLLHRLSIIWGLVYYLTTFNWYFSFGVRTASVKSNELDAAFGICQTCQNKSIRKRAYLNATHNF
jgi:hypothetical protein